MKVREGFVSNSSSSSFIVRFPKAVTCRQDVADAMGECTASPYDTTVPTEDVVDHVWADIQQLAKSPGKLYSEENYEEKPENEVQDELWMERASQVLHHYCDENFDPRRHDPIMVMVRGINGATRDSSMLPKSVDPLLVRKWYTLSKKVEEGWRAPYKKDATPEERRLAHEQGEEMSRQQEALERVVANILKEEWEVTPGATYVLSYCDEGGGFSSALEHGDIFRNLPNQRISHH